DADNSLPLMSQERRPAAPPPPPPPLSAKKFFGSRPFTQINEAVESQGHRPIDWRIPDLG
ncbi:uracil-DNA glycosylase, partial [Streptomyces sp. NPDC047939]